ncbi:MAG: F0F1 ATP synthase subunit gamma [Clostridiaceae bacterium]|nr:F0F1 ATP synthase subunit gamma [Clostridiaceae bacterium]
MAGAGLIEIKGRIRSITNTKKITKAMGLVATAKLRKTRVKLEVNSKYNTYFDEAIKEVLEGFPPETYNIYTHGNESKKKLYIVLTSDSGLCGGFNSNIVNNTVTELSKDRENSLILLVGQKGRAYFKRYKYESVAEFVDIPDLPSITEAYMITNHVLDMYEKGEIGEVYISFTKFISTVNQNVEFKRLLPLGYNEKDEMKEYVILEPGIVEFVIETVKVNINRQVLNCMLNAKASEQGSRMAAMDGATRNADEILENLKLKYNRIRQGAITQEISEIVGGAEAQK